MRRGALLVAAALIPFGGCGGSGRAHAGPPAASNAFACRAISVLPSSIARVLSGEAGRCSAPDQVLAQARAAVDGLPSGERARLLSLSGLHMTGAGDPQAAAALAIAAGVLGAAARRAFPAPPARVQAAALRGVYRPDPALSAIVRDALDPARDPPCEPSGSETATSATAPAPGSSTVSSGGSDLGEAAVQGAIEALLHGGGTRAILAGALKEMFNSGLCERLRELVDQLRKLGEHLRGSPALRDEVALEAKAEGGAGPYGVLLERTLGDYALANALLEIEISSGGAIASQLVAVAGFQARGRGLSGLLSDRALAAGREIEDAP